jgi:hypothetical protein
VRGACRVPEALGRHELPYVHGSLGEPGRGVAAGGHGQPVLDDARGHVRVLDEVLGGPAERPEQVALAIRAEGVRVLVPEAQGPLDRRGRRPGLRAEAAGGGQVEQRLGQCRRVPGLLGLGEQFLGTGKPARAVRRHALGPYVLADLFGRTGGRAGHRASWTADGRAVRAGQRVCARTVRCVPGRAVRVRALGGAPPAVSSCAHRPCPGFLRLSVPAPSGRILGAATLVTPRC